MNAPLVSLQMYTVRDFAEGDAAGAFRKVKEMGYDTVELAGTYGMGGAELRKLLDEAGLSAFSAHVPFGEFEADAEGTAAKYKALGCRVLAIPALPLTHLPGGEAFKKIRKFIPQLSTICNESGMLLGYHNHAFEFQVLDGDFILDRFFGAFSDLLVQLDTGWITAAGQDPAAYIKKYAGRCPVVHLKDTVKLSGGGYQDCPVGQGVQDMPGIIKASLDAEVMCFVVELDESVGLTSLDAARQSREYLKSLGY